MIRVLQLSVLLAALMVLVIRAEAQSREGAWQSQGCGNGPSDQYRVPGVCDTGTGRSSYGAAGSRPGFLGPVVELIGPITMSAAEAFTQALMGRAPHVIRIGQKTQAVFCDSLAAISPTGGVRFRQTSGAPVYADDDVAAGRDPGDGAGAAGA